MTRRKEPTIKRLAFLLRHHLSTFVLAVLATLVQVGLTVYLPVLIGRAVNQTVGLGAVNFDGLWKILRQMAVVIGLNAFIQWINPMLYNKMTFDLVSDLRQQVMAKIHQLPLSFIDQQSTGDLVSRIVTDAEQLNDGMVMIFNQFLLGIFTILATIATMARLDLKMMAMIVLLTPLSLFVSRFIAKKSYHLFKLQSQSRGDQTQLIEENIQQGEIVRLFNNQASQSEAVNALNETYAAYSKQAIFYSSLINPTTRVVNALIYALIAYVGVLRIMSGQFTVGTLTTFLNYANQYTKPFNDISEVLAELQSALASAERLFAILDEVVEVETANQVLQSEDVKGDIRFEALGFSYVAGQDLIEDLSFQASKGQTVAIVGPTGAGKSTLINLLMRFYEPTAGQILLDEVGIQNYSRDSVRAQFGMVLQDSWIRSGTIHENIAYGHPDASREEVVAAAKQSHADYFIQQLAEGYDTVVGPEGVSLSQGQNQLLSIARIFVRLPELLILDEATSSIDTRTELLIQSAFNQLMEGRTSFIVAHRLSTIQAADLILVLDQGQIVEQGNHQELMHNRGLYYEMQMSREATLDS